MTEKIKKTRDNVFAAVLTDMSNAFDCINHELFIAKLNAYQALIQDFVREGGWLAPKNFRGAQRREKFLGLF